MPLKTSHAEELPVVNLTPMIDVVFLLIIFFMVGTQFSERERHIGVTLPGASSLTAMVAPPDRREVGVRADGTVVFDQQAIDATELTRKLRAISDQYPALQVVVRADGEARHQHVVAVYDAANRAGIADVVTAIQPQRR
ncbi:MAG: biopolymer transporter ExbD [Planctomycetales bacterium]|nr:biopolymer transporter ExbD [Planctomycetales bacterium]